MNLADCMLSWIKANSQLPDQIAAMCIIIIIIIITIIMEVGNVVQPDHN